MTPITNPLLRRGFTRATGRALALTATGALALGSVGLSPAAAATTAWDPTTVGLPTLPAPSVDGEITVTQVTGGAGTMKSFQAAANGAAVNYATTVNWRSVTWGPAGDVVSGDATGGSLATGSGQESLFTKSTVRGSQWSPFGDSTTRSTGSGSAFKTAAAWVGSSLVQSFGPDLPVDPGAAAVYPTGAGVVVQLGTAPTRDLGTMAAPPKETIFPRIRNTAIESPLPAPTPLAYGKDAHDAAVGAAGTLAFVGADAGVVHLYIDEGSGATAVADLGLDCPGQRPTFAPSSTKIAYLKNVGATCAKTELHVLTQAAGGTFVGGADVTVSTSPDGSTYETPSWRAKTPNAASGRLAGSDRVATGVAISQAGWDDTSAPVVVLASSGTFPDAIVGGPLAGAAASPLLITPSTKLDSRVLAEIKRVLDPTAGGGVYIIGGTGAVSSAVETALHSAGIPTQRLGGSDRFGTSVKVAQELDAQLGHRTTAFFADGTKFPDALVSGPAATEYSAPVLLTNGTTVPSSVKSYATGAGFTAFFGVGGSAAAAGKAAFPTTIGIFGADRYATSQQVAQYFFPGAGVMGYASGENFPDALTGGAFMAGLWQPLMLARATSLPSVVSAQAYRFRASTDLVLVFGGTAVMSEGVRGQVTVAAGWQTAYFGPGVPTVTNPKFPPTAAMQPGTSGTRGSGTSQSELKSLRDKVQQRGTAAKFSFVR